MKGFEKWYLPDKKVYVNEYEMEKRAWRAALEWLQETMEEIEKHDIPISGQEVIQNELEE